MKLNSSSFKFVYLLFILVLRTQILTLKQLMTLKYIHRKWEKKRGKNASKLVSIRVKPNVDDSTKLNLKQFMKLLTLRIKKQSWWLNVLNVYRKGMKRNMSSIFKCTMKKVLHLNKIHHLNWIPIIPHLTQMMTTMIQTIIRMEHHQLALLATCRAVWEWIHLI